MLYLRKVYQNIPPTSRLSEPFLARREFGGTGDAGGEIGGEEIPMRNRMRKLTKFQLACITGLRLSQVMYQGGYSRDRFCRFLVPYIP
jgi:hypothetical protein